jgi:hypothetical protein
MGMSLRQQHDLHKRRFGLNLGLGLVLAFLVAVLFGLTVAKVSVGGFQVGPAPAQTQTGEGN